MMRVRSLAVLLAALLAHGAAVAAPPDKAAAPAKLAGKEELPKALPRKGETPITPSDMPPYLGIFGSADLIAKVGFRGKAGSYIEYKLESKVKEAGSAHGLRLAQVEPEVPGARWIEMTSKGPGVEGSGLRLLTRGNGKGNIERLVAQSPQAPPLELPLNALTTTAPIAAPTGASGESLLSDVKHIGHEKVEVPLGKFETEHWLIAEKPRLEIWTTKDERVPFIGAVKMLTEEGWAYAAKAGTDATAIISAPGSNSGN
jgi:hypothetical protein